jgi:PII-like signaling protein
LLLIYVDETDRWEDMPLYEAIVRKLRQLGASGATVQAGMMGFGAHGDVHRKRLFGVSDDRPVTIQVCDSAERIKAYLPKIKEMVGEGLIVALDCDRIF